jgi:hypothetical protein
MVQELWNYFLFIYNSKTQKENISKKLGGAFGRV